jgi:hypothetical protein
LDQKLNQVKQANQAKDVTFALASLPVKIRVAASPFTVAAAAPVTVKAGQKAELTINLNRLYGFAEGVDLTFEPANVPGLQAPKVTVAKDQNSGKFEVATGDKTPPGEYAVPVKAKGKFNNVNVEAAVTVMVKVEPAS